jgi:Flp pilus assembly pilin Flp
LRTETGGNFVGFPRSSKNTPHFAKSIRRVVGRALFKMGTALMHLFRHQQNKVKGEKEMLNNLVGWVKASLSGLTGDQRGVTVIEYTVLAALILLASIVLVDQVGGGIETAWTTIASYFPL